MAVTPGVQIVKNLANYMVQANKTAIPSKFNGAITIIVEGWMQAGTGNGTTAGNNRLFFTPINSATAGISLNYDPNSSNNRVRATGVSVSTDSATAATAYTATGSIAPGTTHLVGVEYNYKAKTAKMFLDGAQSGSTVTSIAFANNAYTVGVPDTATYFGCYGTANASPYPPLSTAVQADAGMRLWYAYAFKTDGDTLSAQERSDLYNRVKHPMNVRHDALVFCYEFDATTNGYKDLVSGNTLYDVTNYNLVATSYNFPNMASVVPTVLSVTVAPSRVSVPGSATQNFTATVDQYGGATTTVTWSLQAGSVGTLSNQTGNSVTYTAPAGTGSPQSATLVATSTADNTKTATAAITVPASGATYTSVMVTPSTKTVLTNGSVQLSAVVAGTGSFSPDVAWSVQSGPGTVNSSGFYQAPSTGTSNDRTAVVRATSTAGGIYGESTITVRHVIDTSVPYIDYQDILKRSANSNTRVVSAVATDTHAYVLAERRYVATAGTVPQDSNRSDIVYQRAPLGNNTDPLLFEDEVALINIGSAAGLADTAGPGAKNPTTLFDRLGRLWVFYNTYPAGASNGGAPSGTGSDSARIFYVRRDTVNAAWSAPVEITAQVKNASTANSSADPGSGPVYVGPGSATQYPSTSRTPNRIVVPVAVKFNSSDSALDQKIQARVIWSDDDGVTWGPSPTAGLTGPGKISTTLGGSETQVVVLPNDKLLASLRNDYDISAGLGVSGKRVFALSDDGGATWGPLWAESEIEDKAVMEPIIRVGQSDLFLTSYPNVPGSGTSSASRRDLTIKYINGNIDSSSTWSNSALPNVPHTTPEGNTLYGTQVDTERNGYSALAVSGTGAGARGIDVYEKYTDADGTNNPKYIRVATFNPAFLGLSSFAATIPALVAGTLVSTAVTPTSVSLSLPAPTGGIGPYSYSIQRAAASDTGFTSPTTIVPSTVQSGTATFTDSGLTPSTQYRYRAIQTDSAQGSVTGTTITATTGAALAAGTLSAPTGQTTTSITGMAWTNATGGTGPYTYQLQYKLSSQNASAYQDISGQTTSPGSLTGLTASSTPSTYSFRVKQTDSTGAIVYTNEVTGTPTAASGGGMPDDVYDTNWVDNASTVVGSGANSQGSDTVGGGTGWVDFVGNQFKTINGTGLVNGLDVDPGTVQGISNCLYIGDDAKKFKDGTTFVFSGDANTGAQAAAGFNVLRFSELNGGTGVTHYVGVNAVYFWVNYRGQRVHEEVVALGITQAAFLVSGATISDDGATLSYVVRLYDPASWVSRTNPGPVLKTVPFSYVPVNKPELLQSGRAGVATYNGHTIRRMVTSVATAALVPGMLTATFVGKTKVFFNLTAATGGVGTKTYQLVRDGSDVGAVSTGEVSHVGNTANTTHSYKVRVSDGTNTVETNAVTVTFLPTSAIILGMKYNSRGTSDNQPVSVLTRTVQDVQARSSATTIVEGVNRSISATTTADWVNSLSADIAAFQAREVNWVSLSPSINDTKTAVGITANQSKANLTTIINGLTGAGIKVFLDYEYHGFVVGGTEFPDMATVNGLVDAYNSGMATLANGSTMLLNDTTAPAISDAHQNDYFSSGDKLHFLQNGIDALGIARSRAAGMASLVPLPPVVNAQPVNQSAAAGQTATFTASVTGATGVQARKGGTNVSGATLNNGIASYTTPTLQLSDNGGSYDFLFTGPGGTTPSNTATLTVTASDTNKPTVQSAILNTDGLTGTLTFSEAVTGSFSGFTFAVGGQARAATFAGSGSTRTFTLASVVYQGQTVTRSYSGSSIVDTASTPNALDSFTAQPVTNGSTQVQPQVTSISLTPSITTVAGGASRTFSVTLAGIGNYDPTVTFSIVEPSTGATLTKTSDTTAVLVAPAATDTAQYLTVRAAAVGGLTDDSLVTIPAQGSGGSDQEVYDLIYTYGAPSANQFVRGDRDFYYVPVSAVRAMDGLPVELPARGYVGAFTFGSGPAAVSVPGEWTARAGKWVQMARLGSAGLDNLPAKVLPVLLTIEHPSGERVTQSIGMLRVLEEGGEG